jgi:hypothetical protein
VSSRGSTTSAIRKVVTHRLAAIEHLVDEVVAMS